MDEDDSDNFCHSLMRPLPQLFMQSRADTRIPKITGMNRFTFWGSAKLLLG